MPEEVEILNASVLEDLIKSGMVSSRSELKRLIEQEGIKINDKTIGDIDVKLKNGDVLRIGKRRVVKISSK